MKSLRLTFLLICVAGTVTAWLCRPAYRAYKEKKFAALAGEALTKHEYRKALLSAQQALVLNSSNLVACRVMADLADEARSPQAIAWRRKIADAAPTLENRILLASCALRYETSPFPMAGATLKQIAGTAGASNSVPFHVVSAQMALKQNQVAEAEAHFEQAIRIEPTNELHRLNLAVVRLESKDASVSAGAKAELLRLRQIEPWAAPALRSLVVHSTVRREFNEAAEHSSLLLRNTNAMFSDKLAHLSILRGARSPELKSYLQKLEREAATNAIASSDLMANMTGAGAADDAIAWFKSLPASAQNELPLPIAVSECYAQSGRWRDLENFLTEQRWREQDFLRKALLAHAIRMQKQDAVVAVHWNEALELAAERIEALSVLVQLSSKWGWTNECEGVLWRAAQNFSRETWPVETLQRSYLRMGNTPRLLEVTALVLERQPTNAVAQNNWATLAFLLQTNLAKAHQLAQQVYEHNTNHFAFVATYAWSLHLQGKTAEAVKIIEGLKPAELEDPSVASYYGVLLAASGQGEKAQRYFAKAEKAPILPEELKLIADARKRL